MVKRSTQYFGKHVDFDGVQLTFVDGPSCTWTAAEQSEALALIKKGAELYSSCKKKEDVAKVVGSDPELQDLPLDNKLARMGLIVWGWDMRSSDKLFLHKLN